MDKAAIVTHNALYRYTGKTLDSKNSPANFQRETDIILTTVK